LLSLSSLEVADLVRIAMSLSPGRGVGGVCLEKVLLFSSLGSSFLHPSLKSCYPSVLDSKVTAKWLKREQLRTKTDTK
jgi:hypothetical protein